MEERRESARGELMGWANRSQVVRSCPRENVSKRSSDCEEDAWGIRSAEAGIEGAGYTPKRKY
jgi:hypothetical protein